jgi:uncharacterized OB-fold protein
MSTGSYVPQPEWLNLEWHHASIAAGVLCVQRCVSCGIWRQPPRRFCAACASEDAAFEPVVGHGHVVSFAVSHRSLDPGWADAAPFATLVVELEEGPRIVAATTVAPTEVTIGLPVQLRIEPRGDDFALVWADPVAFDSLGSLRAVRS